MANKKNNTDLTDAVLRRIGATSRKVGRSAEWPPNQRDNGGTFFPEGDSGEGRTDRPAGHLGKTR